MRLYKYVGREFHIGESSSFKDKELRKDLRSSINYLSHFNALPEEMTVYKALKFYSDMEGGDPLSC